MDTRKERIITALGAWIRQRPGLEFGNYGDVSAYRSEMRCITRQLHDARTLLAAVSWRDSITADDLLAAARAYSGRLSITEKDGGVQIDYCTGQYWPTEYRAAACAVLGQAMFDWARDKCMPSDETKLANISPGTFIRSSLRREFGRHLQSRWMD